MDKSSPIALLLYVVIRNVIILIAHLIPLFLYVMWLFCLRVTMVSWDSALMFESYSNFFRFSLSLMVVIGHRLVMISCSQTIPLWSFILTTKYLFDELALDLDLWSFFFKVLISSTIIANCTSVLNFITRSSSNIFWKFDVLSCDSLLLGWKECLDILNFVKKCSQDKTN